MTEPYHPFIKRTPAGDEMDNMCATCDRGPGDPVHNPAGQCTKCKRLLSESDRMIFETRGNQMFCHLCKRVFTVTVPAHKEKPPAEAEGEAQGS